MKISDAVQNPSNTLNDTDPYDIGNDPGDIDASEKSDQSQSPDPAMNALKHGAAAYERSGRLPVEWEGYDRELARELLSLVGGAERFFGMHAGGQESHFGRDGFQLARKG